MSTEERNIPSVPLDLQANCRFCGSSNHESRFIEQKFYAPDDKHQERARYKYVYFRFCNTCGAQGPQADKPEDASARWGYQLDAGRPSSGGDANRQAQAPYCYVLPGDDTAKANGWIDARLTSEGEFTKPLYEHPSVATEEQRPVDDDVFEPLSLLYTALVTEMSEDRTITSEQQRYRDDVARRLDKAYAQSVSKWSAWKRQHPSPSQDAIMGAAREIVMALNGEGYIQSLSAWTGNHLEQNIAAILIKHLGPVKHE